MLHGALLSMPFKATKQEVNRGGGGARHTGFGSLRSSALKSPCPQGPPLHKGCGVSMLRFQDKQVGGNAPKEQFCMHFRGG